MTPTLKTGFGTIARLGAAGGVLLFLGLFAWAYVVLISGAVIATGTVAIEGKPKQVQHFDGGVIEEIRVAEGDIVERGEVLIVLDKTLLEANIAIYKARLADLIARQARLEAEQIGADAPSPPKIPDLLTGFDAKVYLAGQSELFQARRELREGREAQLKEKVVQFENQIAGVQGLLEAKQRQLELIREELTSATELEDKGLLVASKLLSIRRSEADLEGQVSEHISEIARIRNSIQDTQMEILQNRRQFREQVVTENRDVVTQIGELRHQILSTQNQLDRVALRAPVSGIVHEMQVFTQGGVVPPGGTVLQIVPVRQDLVFELRVDPASIDQVHVDQVAKIRFSAFDQRATPELTGQVARISPTTLQDPQSGVHYYKVEAEIGADELAKLEGQDLVPGMPVEGFLQTNARSVLSYFLKPLSDHLRRAFRER